MEISFQMFNTWTNKSSKNVYIRAVLVFITDFKMYLASHTNMSLSHEVNREQGNLGLIM